MLKPLFWILQHMKKRIYIAYTGGTIGMKASENGYIPEKGHLTESILANVDFHREEMPEFTIHEYSPLIDSSNMSPSDWQYIADDIKSHYQNQ